jgi:uncharacterized RDD family membrane protein YckC
VDLEDRITIATPEGLELELQLAGLGSRFIAGAADLLIQVVTIVILAAITGALSGDSGLLVAAFVIGSFAIAFLYPVAFELLAAGRTPGKRLAHLRVVRASGAPVDLPSSAIRNLVRLLDGPATLYLPTIVAVVLTRFNQRPGDLAAGTIVVRELPLPKPRKPARALPGGSPVGWDVSAVTPDELAAVRRFLERRDSLERAARSGLALRLASGLRAKVTGAPEQLPAERFLEQLTSAKDGSP